MSKQVNNCDRCEAKIVEESHTRRERMTVFRKSNDRYEDKTVHLCTICHDELWQWVEGEDIDRSEVADPVPLDRMAENVDRHITDLQDVLIELESKKKAGE